MRSQALIIEYVLLVILGLFVANLTINWLYDHKNDFFSSINIQKSNILRDYLSNLLYNMRFFSNSSIEIPIDYKSYCSGSVFIIEFGPLCRSKTFSGEYIGDYIVNRTLVFIYSNNTKIYYKGILVGYKLASVCYEGKMSYAILSDYCRAIECEKCKISIKKYGDKFMIE